RCGGRRDAETNVGTRSNDSAGARDKGRAPHMQQPLNSYGIVAYTWLNALGARTYRAPEATSPWLLEGTGLRPAAELPFATHWGPVTTTLPPMPPEVAGHRSRCSQLLWASLRA